MGTNTVAVSAVAGSSGSAPSHPAPGKEVAAGSGSAKAPAPSAGTESKKPKRPSMLYDPRNSLSAARKAVERAGGHADPTVVGASADVERRIRELVDRTDELRHLEQAEEDATHAQAAAALAVEEALAPAAWKLRKRIHGGAALYEECQSKGDPVSTSREVIRRVTAGKVPLGDHLMANLHSAVGGMEKPTQALLAAKRRTAAARKAFVAARRRLDASVPVLTTSMLQTRVAARAALLLAQNGGAPTKHGKKGG